MFNWSNLMAGALIGPLVLLLAALSLATFQRAIEWIQVTATTPQEGTMQTIKPLVKHVYRFVKRIFGVGLKIEVSTTNMLLMGIIIVLIMIALETAEQSKVKTVTKTYSTKKVKVDKGD